MSKRKREEDPGCPIYAQLLPELRIEVRSHLALPERFALTQCNRDEYQHLPFRLPLPWTTPVERAHELWPDSRRDLSCALRHLLWHDKGLTHMLLGSKVQLDLICDLQSTSLPCLGQAQLISWVALQEHRLNCRGLVFSWSYESEALTLILDLDQPPVDWFWDVWSHGWFVPRYRQMLVARPWEGLSPKLRKEVDRLLLLSKT